jgi:HAMP domain-containing protein/signal transduction histidine kinase/DNA-binding response OmpR family regulator
MAAVIDASPELDVSKLLAVLRAVRKGDFSVRLPEEWTGTAGKVADTLNEVIELNERFAQELQRLSAAVGQRGRIQERAALGPVTGAWSESVSSVNALVASLGQPTSEAARVIGAVAKGDLSQRIALEIDGQPLEGEFLRTARTVNRMVDQLGAFAAEVTRVVREVGTEGTLGGQARVKGVSGTWRDLTDSVNSMAGNLTAQVRNIAEVTTAVANGDLSRKITVDVRGEVLELKNTINTMVDQLRSFASEVTRVAREVGTEGKLGGQARVEGVSGTWRDLTDSVNSMAGNLTSQVRNIAEVTTAVANGDLSKQITVDVRGEILELKNTINTMVDQLSSFASEVTRVAREVGTEGKLGGQADVKGVAGTWKDLTDSVNYMARNLTEQVRNIADVTKAVANGDLSRQITVDVKGEILELKDTVNRMVDQLSSFAAEVTRVAREVGTEGKLGAQADVKGVAGTWKDLTDSVNSMASNLTAQVRSIADVTKAVANGDLSKKITVNVRGEILELKNTINTMVDQLGSFASEVTRVAREVGTEGKLGGQADVRDVAGTWKDLTDSVNSMASNLTAQVRNIAEVTTAVANGDLSKKITVDVRGEILELKDTINTMVDQLRSFAAEVTRVAREVGTEGKLGGQADVRDVAGTWKDLTDSVNRMASNLTDQVRNIADVTTAVANGDLSRKITVDVRGEILQLKDTVNRMVDQLRSFAAEVTRVAREVGTDGRLGGQADVHGVAGTWRDLTDSVNFMASNLTAQVRNIADVTKAVANGDLSRKITVDVKGEILELKDTVNRMVDQLSSFAAEVTRVAREVGTEGKLGGQAQVQGVSGVWKDLTDNVNFMAGNLTSQVRGIARVVTAVAHGALRQKLTVEAKGEIAALADTINSMIDTLATFADQVTSVAREVGVEGRLGGQARVPGAAGTWKDLTDTVNQLADKLTTQVRAIAEVATAVTKGDLTRAITVDARGEVAILKDTTNEMIRNLRETTLKNSEQDWLKTNLAKFSRMLQGQKDLLTVGRLILSELAPVVSAQHGAFYLLASEAEPRLTLLAAYAYRARPDAGAEFAMGEGLVGQCALEKRKIVLDHVPPDYIRISSGLGSAAPLNLIVLPVIFETHVRGVIELASFDRFNPTHHAFLDQLMESIGIVINTIEANTRTEDLLKQSQSLASELQQTNQELEDKARLLAHQNAEVERKNEEVEQARQALEEKATQLALTSKYKSEFLANMSHELRTPLNSLLILSDQLSRNLDGNLSHRQMDYAKTIHSSGNDLLNLINDILDLSKIESGTVVVDVGELRFADLHAFVERTFNHVAESKNLPFAIDLHPDLPRAIQTDAKRLQQILKNLLSNAFKFTRQGRVGLSIAPAEAGTRFESENLKTQEFVIGFAVVDTGIGIPADKQQIIFEAFQQADGSTSRKYGGTGLGLAISRELAALLGGEIHLVSAPGQGSAFTLFLPGGFLPAPPRRTPAIDAVSVPGREAVAPALPEAAEPVDEVGDDRADIAPGDRVLLVVENDLTFARMVLDAAHQHGYKAIITGFGAAALTLTERFAPEAITLDISLPDISGWRILERLKRAPATRHIPVYLITTEEDRARGLRAGALGFATKPLASLDAVNRVIAAIRGYVSDPVRTVLVAMADPARRTEIGGLLERADTRVVGVSSGAEALAALDRARIDCAVVDPGLPEPVDVLVERLLAVAPDLPVLVHRGEPAPEAQAQALRRLAQQAIVKEVLSPDRLLDQVALFLHRRFDELSEAQRRTIGDLHSGDKSLAGRAVLIVDDDIRNIFALTSILEQHHMVAVAAETGRDAIAALERTPHIEAVLMDVMMPEMDGFDTTRTIRQNPRFRELPIIAVTAKAMRGDRERCIEAGAWDYLSKPVDPGELLAMLRAWLVR